MSDSCVKPCFCATFFIWTSLMLGITFVVYMANPSDYEYAWGDKRYVKFPHYDAPAIDHAAYISPDGMHMTQYAEYRDLEGCGRLHVAYSATFVAEDLPKKIIALDYEPSVRRVQCEGTDGLRITWASRADAEAALRRVSMPQARIFGSDLWTESCQALSGNADDRTLKLVVLGDATRVGSDTLMRVTVVPYEEIFADLSIEYECSSGNETDTGLVAATGTGSFEPLIVTRLRNRVVGIATSLQTAASTAVSVVRNAALLLVKGELEVQPRTYHFAEYTLSNISLGDEPAGMVADMQMSLGGRFSLNIRQRQLRTAEMSLRGSLGLNLRTTASLTTTQETLLAGGTIGTIVVMVGPVPVSLTGHYSLSVSSSVEMQIETAVGVFLQNLAFGVRFDEGSWSPVSGGEMSTGMPTSPNVIVGSASVVLVPKLQMTIAKVGGPTIVISPFLVASADASGSVCAGWGLSGHVGASLSNALCPGCASASLQLFEHVSPFPWSAC